VTKKKKLSTDDTALLDHLLSFALVKRKGE